MQIKVDLETIRADFGNCNLTHTLGAEGIRDPEHPCHLFKTGKPAGDCFSDGHYLCKECVEYCPPAERIEDEE